MKCIRYSLLAPSSCISSALSSISLKCGPGLIPRVIRSFPVTSLGALILSSVKSGSASFATRNL